MTKQFTAAGPYVLPITEQLMFAVTHLGAKYFPKSWNIKPFIPDFKRSIDHFCIHAGGRAVIEGVQKNLKLADIDVEPSFMTLKNYGNTSSSSIWYELRYIEENRQRLKCEPGNRILQIAFGSGFKCNSAVWLKL